MGTRHLIMVFDKNNVLKVAQYGQWDGCPSGQGVDVLNFAKDKDKMAKLEAELKNIKFYNDDKDLLMWVGGYNERCPHYNSHGVKLESRLDESDKYWFGKTQTRNLGAQILNSIITLDKEQLPEDHKKFIVLYNDIDFLKDSLLCEWAYAINFNTNKLQVFGGFNQDKSKEYKLCKTNEKEIAEHFKGRDYKYYGCALLKEYDLNDLPTEEEFLKDLESNDDNNGE